MSSLPVAWIAAGCLLLLLAVVMAILFYLKAREVATLKKQCEDLRETMRMMRYEESNLARMLHTASRPMPLVEVPVAPVEEEQTEENAVQVETLAAAETMVEEVAEDSDEEILEQVVPEISTGEENFEDESIIISEQVVPETSDNSPILENSEAAEAVAGEALEEEVIEAEASQSPMSQPHKHPINERRPAIPNDLFSAWFAENEEASEEEVATSSEAIEEPVIESPKVEEVVVEECVSQEDRVEATLEEPQTANPDQEIELSKEDERFCRKLERIVQSRLRNPNLNIDIIAAQFGIGRTNFYRKVRELMGMSPNDYLRKCRMERAAELLKTSEQPISEVCAQVGIPDAQYFSRVFKAYYGTAPSAYREQ